jgi:hypothetical protein
MSENYENLKQLHEMKEKGDLSEEEYNDLKKEILDSESEGHELKSNPGMFHIVAGALAAGISGFLLLVLSTIITPIIIGEMSNNGFAYSDPPLLEEYLSNFFGSLDVLTIILFVFLALLIIAGYIFVIIGLDISKRVVDKQGKIGINMLITSLILLIVGPIVFYLYSSLGLVSVTPPTLVKITDTYLAYMIMGFIIGFLLVEFGYLIGYLGISKLKLSLSNPKGMGFISAFFLIGVFSMALGPFAPLAWIVGYILLMVGIFELKSYFDKAKSNHDEN